MSLIKDERDQTANRIVSDKAFFITYIYVNTFLIILTILDIVTSGKLGLPLIIVVLQFIFYSVTKVILINHYGENIL